MNRDFVYICSSIFNYLWALFYCAQGAGAAGRKCTMKINARRASGFGLVAIFGIMVWTERTSYTCSRSCSRREACLPPIPSVCMHWMHRKCYVA